MKQHPCLSCGACCAMFRVSFYWTEADDATSGGVPVELTEKLTHHRIMMLGTSGSHPRCVALEGTVGEEVRCRIHPQRPTPCREFAVSYEDGTGPHHERCDAARARHGLSPLTPADWL